MIKKFYDTDCDLKEIAGLCSFFDTHHFEPVIGGFLRVLAAFSQTDQSCAAA